MDLERGIATAAVGFLGGSLGFTAAALYDAGRYAFSSSQNESSYVASLDFRTDNYKEADPILIMEPAWRVYGVLSGVGTLLGAGLFNLPRRARKPEEGKLNRKIGFASP